MKHEEKAVDGVERGVRGTPFPFYEKYVLLSKPDDFS